MREYLNRLPDHHRIPLTTPRPSQDALEAEEWLWSASRPAARPRAALTPAPSDFTARVMARIETPEQLVAAAAPPQSRSTVAPALRPLRIAGSVVGFAGLLALGTLAGAFLLAPAALVTLLNALVGALVSVLLLLTPLLDATAALAANNTLMLSLTALVAGIAIVWSRMHTSITELAREV